MGKIEPRAFSRGTMKAHCCDCGDKYETTEEKFSAQTWPVCPPCRAFIARRIAFEAARDALIEAAVAWRKIDYAGAGDDQALMDAIDAYLAAGEAARKGGEEAKP